jgi:hypothetical protein
MVVLCVASACLQTAWGSAPAISHWATFAIGFSQPKLVYLHPGTKLTEKPPEGWSHLVLKSLPRLASGDQADLPTSASKIATMFRTFIVANVKPLDLAEKDFILDMIGIGLCTPNEEGSDTVVNGERADALGLHLSTVERLVLDATEAKLAEGRVIVRTPTFALFRGPALLATAGKHHKVDVYYAFCVERTTGRLHVAVWSLPTPGFRATPPPVQMVALGSSKPSYDCPVDVRATRILGLPINYSFAMQDLPPGRVLEIPTTLGESLVEAARSPSKVDAEEMETAIRKLLVTVPDVVKAVYESVPAAPVIPLPKPPR